MSSNREREKMGYWAHLKKFNQEIYTPPEKLYCKLCGKELPRGYLPRLVYGVGFICKECSDKRMNKGKKK